MLTVLWRKVSRTAVVVGSVGGSSLALVAWLVTCRFVYGTINTTNLASNFSSLAGNLVSMYGGGLICVVISLIWPDNYDFKGTRGSKQQLNLFDCIDLNILSFFKSKSYPRRKPTSSQHLMLRETSRNIQIRRNLVLKDHRQCRDRSRILFQSKSTRLQRM